MTDARMTPDDPTTAGAVAERFWRFVDKRADDECWAWTGAVVARDGRGLLTVNNRNTPAPRVSLMVHGSFPPAKDSFACHTCDNPNCVNPAHLWWGSNSANLKDASAKGRLPLQQRSQCKHGHDFSPENTRFNSRGQRQCKACQTRMRLAGARKKAAAKAMPWGSKA